MNKLLIFLFSGAYFILDGQEQDICKNIDIKKPLWAVIDIYGNVKGIEFERKIKKINCLLFDISVSNFKIR